MNCTEGGRVKWAGGPLGVTLWEFISDTGTQEKDSGRSFAVPSWNIRNKTVRKMMNKELEPLKCHSSHS